MPKYRMRKYINIIEQYSEPNSTLLRHLGNQGFDFYRYWWEICKWAEDTDELEAFSEVAGEPIESANELNEHEADLFAKLPQHLQRDAEEWVLEYLNTNDPSELPSASFFTPTKKLIPRGTWLAHFTDEPDAIISAGFTKGTDDMDRLGLTTYRKNEYKSKGYNFAFEATGRYAEFAAQKRKYGRDCLLFQNSGVKAWHNGDEEDQVIFWGPEVDKRGIIVLEYSEGDWAVLANDRRTLFTGEFEAAVKWVIQNHHQYRRMLYRS